MKANLKAKLDGNMPKVAELATVQPGMGSPATNSSFYYLYNI
jgi:hypothetical protein